jgi:YL1 nuclear protein C-terminal domain
MASATARRAWNDAMKATAGAAALPPALQLANKKRRSDRHKKQDRRIKARKGTLFNNSRSESKSDQDYRIALWVDALEGIDPTTSGRTEGDDEEEEYDELEEFEEGSGKKKKKRAANKRESKKSKSSVASMPKRYLPKSFGSLLLEEAYRVGTDDDEINAARCYIESEAHILPGEQQLPRRKFCPVTGTLALYTEPKSGIPYSSLRALEQIRERAPAWMMTQNSGGVASYYEAVKSLEER